MSPQVLRRCDENFDGLRFDAPDSACSWRIHAQGNSIIRNVYPDVTKASFFNSDLITSRKRTKQLGDLFSKWRTTLLNEFIDPDLMGSDIDV